MNGFVIIRSATPIVSVTGVTYTLNDGPEALATVTRPYTGAVPSEVVPRLLKRPFNCEVVGPAEGPTEVPSHPAAAVTEDGGAEGVAHTPKALPVVTPPTLYPHPFKVGDTFKAADGKEYRVTALKGSEVFTEHIVAPAAA
jgi:hypothetical protein